MIDWYVLLLAPLVALPIVLLFAFVGQDCAGYPGFAAEPLEPDDPFLFGSVSTSWRVQLNYNIPPKSPKLNKIEVTFKTVSKTDDLVLGPFTKPLSWSTANQPEADKLGPFEHELWAGPRDWTCTVLLHIDGGGNPLMREKTLNQVDFFNIQFDLVYAEWPPPSPDYDWNKFSLSGGKIF